MERLLKLKQNTSRRRRPLGQIQVGSFDKCSFQWKVAQLPNELTNIV